MLEPGLDPLDPTPHSVVFNVGTADPAPLLSPHLILTSASHPTRVPAVIRDCKVGGFGGEPGDRKPIRTGSDTPTVILFSMPVSAAYSTLVPADQSISGEGRAPGRDTEHTGTGFSVVSESDTRSVMCTIVIFYSNEE